MLYCWDISTTERPHCWTLCVGHRMWMKRNIVLHRFVLWWNHSINSALLFPTYFSDHPHEAHIHFCSEAHHYRGYTRYSFAQCLCRIIFCSNTHVFTPRALSLRPGSVLPNAQLRCVHCRYRAAPGCSRRWSKCCIILYGEYLLYRVTSQFRCSSMVHADLPADAREHRHFGRTGNPGHRLHQQDRLTSLSGYQQVRCLFILRLLVGIEEIMPVYAHAHD